MSTIPIETDSIGLNDNTPLQIYLIEFPINCIRLLKDYIILKEEDVLATMQVVEV